MSRSRERSTLRAHGLACARGDRTVFCNLGFELTNGGLLRVGGANGRGKTSLLRIVCGLLEPAAGTIYWNGEPTRTLGEDFHRALAYVGHLNGAKDELDVHENLIHAASSTGLAATPEDIAAALAVFSLDRLVGLQCKFLSQGQRRRLALARLRLCLSRPLWILDEPFVALDVAGIEVVRMMIEEHLGAGGMVMLTTHQEIAFASAGAQRIELSA